MTPHDARRRAVATRVLRLRRGHTWPRGSLATSRPSPGAATPPPLRVSSRRRAVRVAESGRGGRAPASGRSPHPHPMHSVWRGRSCRRAPSLSSSSAVPTVLLDARGISQSLRAPLRSCQKSAAPSEMVEDRHPPAPGRVERDHIIARSFSNLVALPPMNLLKHRNPWARLDHPFPAAPPFS